MSKTSRAATPLANPFPLVDTKYLKSNFGQSEADITSMRRSLTTPTYWVQRDRKVYYNLRLWEHYLRCVTNGNSGDRLNHDRLLEAYSAYLDNLIN